MGTSVGPSSPTRVPTPDRHVFRACSLVKRLALAIIVATDKRRRRVCFFPPTESTATKRLSPDHPSPTAVMRLHRTRGGRTHTKNRLSNGEAVHKGDHRPPRDNTR